MHGKIVLLYETETGQLLCDLASRVLAEIAVAFRHTLSLPVKRCQAGELSDEVLALCDGALGVLSSQSDMAVLPELAEELGCLARVRELRYSHLIENRALTGKPLNCLVVQAVTGEKASLDAAAMQAFRLSNKENLPIVQIPPTGKMAVEWEQTVAYADTQSTVFHARSMSLIDAIPEMIHDAARFGVLLCPPYGGGVLSRAAAALSGGEGMCLDVYTDGECPICAALSQQDGTCNPIGMLRAVEELLQRMKLDREAACVEAGIRNVLQAGWRTQDAAQEGFPTLDAAGMVELVCRQIEVAGEWITSI